MKSKKIIIIGAGASGLMAALQLSKAGFKVEILEARDRVGGRIHTIKNSSFSIPVEAGAEFIHGRLPVTLGLLKEYGIKYHEAEGRMYRWKNGVIKKEDDFIEHHTLLEKHLKEFKQDITIENFLDTHFTDEKYDDFKQSIKKFVEGYDAADTKLASTLAFRDEWLKDDDDDQYRIEGGYSQLMNALADDCRKYNCAFHFSSIVKEINWKERIVEVISADKRKYIADKVIVTVPLGILQLEESDQRAIIFNPPLEEKKQAAKNLGYGTIIKFLIEFKHSFWNDEKVQERIDKKLNQLGWIISDEKIPTWWTQLPVKTPLLTGWLGGPDAVSFSAFSDDELLNIACDTLTSVFKTTPDKISELIKTSQVFSWFNDPYACGAYSYATIEWQKHIKVIAEPVADLLFFAGEGLHITNTGTVEAAFESGLETVSKIMSC